MLGFLKSVNLFYTLVDLLSWICGDSSIKEYFSRYQDQQGIVSSGILYPEIVKDICSFVESKLSSPSYFDSLEYMKLGATVFDALNCFIVGDIDVLTKSSSIFDVSFAVAVVTCAVHNTLLSLEGVRASNESLELLTEDVDVFLCKAISLLGYLFLPIVALDSRLDVANSNFQNEDCQSTLSPYPAIFLLPPVVTFICQLPIRFFANERYA